MIAHKDAAAGVGGQEPPPAHPAGAGQERGLGAQDRHEPAEEHCPRPFVDVQTRPAAIAGVATDREP
jgi:hypothetical protein